MPILARNPLDEENRVPRAGQIQAPPPIQEEEGMGSKLANLAIENTATKAMAPGGLLGTAAVGETAATQGLLGAGGVFGPSTGTIGSAISSGLGAAQGSLATGLASSLPGASTIASGIGAATPALAAMGPLALLALPFLLNNGTNNVPEIDYGPDPLAQGYNYGTAGVKPTTNMAYAGGTDSVPAMLTPGEAVIPAAAAQNPANKPMINSMVNEGRAANDMADGMPQVDMSVMAGPLSGKAKREQMKLLQDMSFKKKAFEAEEQRKQQAFDQKMSQSKMQYMLAMRQSQE